MKRDLTQTKVEHDNGSETEKSIIDKFSNNKLPNYGTLPKLNLEDEIVKLRNADLNQDYKKDVNTLIQKPQTGRVDNHEPTDRISLKNSEDVILPPQDVIKRHTKGKIINKDFQKTMNCRFLSSPQCHPEYPNFSGAGFSFPGDMKMKVDSIGDTKPAHVICTISKGAINGAYVIDAGEGYQNPPKLTIVGGGGSNAILEPVVKGGKILDVKVKSGGYGFIETPSIQVEDPNLSNGLYLCCK